MKYLGEIFEKYGIKLDKNQQNQFDLYFSYLVEENKKMNLTAITEEKDVVIKHFLDSVLPYNLLEKNSKIIDVGSGAGFPAIPLKIVRPDLEVYMVDSLNKRVNFLNEAIKLLKLEKTYAIHARIEDFAIKNREKFDFALARAVAPLNTLVEYLLPLVKIQGRTLIYKSNKLEEELMQVQNAISILGGKVLHIHDYYIEEENLQRYVLEILKERNTPNKYPRSQNKPKINPLS